jgi:hypothetical protein
MDEAAREILPENLHDGDGAHAHERDGYGVGEDAVAGGAASGAGGVEEGGGSE